MDLALGADGGDAEAVALDETASLVQGPLKKRRVPCQQRQQCQQECMHVSKCQRECVEHLALGAGGGDAEAVPRLDCLTCGLDCLIYVALTVLYLP